MPQDRATSRVDGIHAVTFGGGDDRTVDDERLGVDRAVQDGRPPGSKRAGERRKGGILAGSAGVLVIDGPVGGGNGGAGTTRNGRMRNSGSRPCARCSCPQVGTRGTRGDQRCQGKKRQGKSGGDPSVTSGMIDIRRSDHGAPFLASLGPA